MSSVLDEVLGRVNILDVVSQYVKLRRSGRNFIGLCPFHKEKTPSFTVSIEKQIYYCFGCHEGGNAVNFLAKYERSSFQEALETLAHQVGIESTGQDRRRGGRPSSTPSRSWPTITTSASCNERPRPSSTSSDRKIERPRLSRIQARLQREEELRRRRSSRPASACPSICSCSTGIVKTRDGGELYDIFRGRIVVPIRDVAREGRRLRRAGHRQRRSCRST